MPTTLVYACQITPAAECSHAPTHHSTPLLPRSGQSQPYVEIVAPSRSPGSVLGAPPFTLPSGGAFVRMRQVASSLPHSTGCSLTATTAVSGGRSGKARCPNHQLRHLFDAHNTSPKRPAPAQAPEPPVPFIPPVCNPLLFGLPEVDSSDASQFENTLPYKSRPQPPPPATTSAFPDVSNTKVPPLAPGQPCCPTKTYKKELKGIVILSRMIAPRHRSA